MLADGVPNMVWAARPGGALEYFNARVIEYSGLSAAELRGWRWKRLVHPEDWAKCFARWTGALANGGRYEVECRMRRADGEYRWHAGAALPRRDAGGQIVRWFGTWTDIDTRKRAEALLLRASERLEAMLAERMRAPDPGDNPMRQAIVGRTEQMKARDAAERLLAETLSARERQVLQLIVEGRTSAEVAARLSLSPKSVDTYRSRLMAKLALEDLPALVKFAVRHGVTTLE